MSEFDDLLDPTTTVNTSYGNEKSLPNAAATLVLGIISIVMCWLYGIPSVICGIIALSLHQKDRKLYKTDMRSYETSFKTAKAGFVCAVIGTSLSAVWFVLYGAAIIAAFF